MAKLILVLSRSNWFYSVFVFPVLLLSLERGIRLPRRPINPWRWLGIVSLAVGLLLQVCSYRTLRERGEGTPNPANPPRLLVQQGPYQYMRNPMMLSLLLLFSGFGLAVRSLLVLLYAAGLAAAIHTYIVRVEEPELAERFGEAYRDYKQRVPRWLALGLGSLAQKV